MNIWQELRNQTRNIRLLKSMNLVFNTVIVIIVSTVIITSFIALLYLNVKKGFTDLALSTGLMAITTIALAFLTYWNIHSRNTQEKRDRKERLLNEILDWATNIAKSRFAKACKELLQITDSSGETSYKKSLQFIHADIVEIKESFVGIESQSRYISKIALTFGAELHKTTEAVTEKIDEYVNYLNDWQNALANDIAKQKKHVDLKARVSKADEIGLQMDRSAIKLMEEAAKIKSRDIS